MEAVIGGRVMEWLAGFYHIIAGMSYLLAAPAPLRHAEVTLSG
jgi:hypothetical protein